MSSNQNATDFSFLFSYVLAVIQYYTVKISRTSRSLCCTVTISWCCEGVFVHEFSDFQKTPAGCVMFISLSTSNTSAPSEGIFVKFYILGLYWNTSWKLKLYKNLTKVPSIYAMLTVNLVAQKHKSEGTAVFTWQNLSYVLSCWQQESYI
jgi:hypothetical protein